MVKINRRMVFAGILVVAIVVFLFLFFTHSGNDIVGRAISVLDPVSPGVVLE